MQDSATYSLCFKTAPLELEAAFDGGRITSDGGLLWLARIDRDLRMCEAVAEHVPQWRCERSLRHSLATLVRQRVYQIACGYEDQNDAHTLRKDPLLKLVLDRLPETGVDLASQPTLSRLENAPSAKDCVRIARVLGEVYVRQRGKDGAPKKILLDFDSTDDPTHGEQEGSAYHGYHRQRMYHPLLVFDGETNQLVTAVLRGGATHASKGALSILKRIVERIRRAWDGVRVEIRADAGFAVPEIYDYCQKEGIHYTIGLISNPRLEAIAKPLLARAKRESSERDGQKVRLLSEAPYRAQSWDRPRRVVYKAEMLQKGENTRFVVSSRRDEPKKLYESYVRRGESEGWIKDFKRALKADRLSCMRFFANQFRLLLHAAAYWLLDEIRRRLVDAGVGRMQLDTLRLVVLKIGARVRQLLTKVGLHLASGHPGQHLWYALYSAEPRRARE
jgi:Transposase DDE domain group 1